MCGRGEAGMKGLGGGGGGEWNERGGPKVGGGGGRGTEGEVDAELT